MATTNVLTTAFGENPLTDAIIDRYMYSKVLSIAMRKTVFWKLGKMVTIPKGESKTITFQRFERLVTPRKPLTEGQTPVGKKLSVTKVTAVAEQWGDFVTLTDVAELTVRHEPFQRALELIGLDAAMTVDREVQRVLLAGSNVYFPNSRANRAALLSTDVLNTPLLRKILAHLKDDGAPAYEGNRYVGVCDPFHSADIQADTTFVSAAQYSNLSALQDAEIGIWQKVRWMESNNMPYLASSATANPTSATAASATGTDVDLTNADYACALIGLDSNGFEVLYSLTPDTANTCSSQILTVVTPAFPDGIVAWNVYIKKDTGTYLLTAEDIDESTTITINKGGAHATGDSFDFSAATVIMGLAPASGVEVHYAYIFGNEYFACTELSGIQVLKTPAGPTHGNELDQRRSIGWKAFFKACITNETYGCRIEAATANK